MSTRAQNERKFASWDELAGGGRRYRLDVTGRLGWRARYLKEVDAAEATLRFNSRVHRGQVIALIDPTISETQLTDAQAGLQRAQPGGLATHAFGDAVGLKGAVQPRRRRPVAVAEPVVTRLFSVRPIKWTTIGGELLTMCKFVDIDLELEGLLSSSN